MKASTPGSSISRQRKKFFSPRTYILILVALVAMVWLFEVAERGEPEYGEPRFRTDIEPLDSKSTWGVVNDSITAVRIARAVCSEWTESGAYSEPLHAKLFGDTVWVVTGVLPKGSLGGYPELLIGKRDGRIMALEWGK